MSKATFDNSIGQMVTFIYHDKVRWGEVVKVGETAVTLKLDGDEEGKEYKAFRYDKMRNAAR